MLTQKQMIQNEIYSLERLYQDKRLARVFQKENGNLALLQLWLLDLLRNQNQEFQLLYGWIIPTTRTSRGWYIKDGGDGQSTESKSFKYRIAKLTLVESGENIYQLISQLLGVTKLGDVCKNIGISEPQARVPYSEFQLVTLAEDLEKLFAVRPVVFQPAKDFAANFINKVRPMTSPYSRNPAFVGSLFRLDKTDLFAYEDEITKYCLKELQADTGLKFCGSDSGRFGNLEWFAFPSADDWGNSYVDFQINVIEERPGKIEHKSKGKIYRNLSVNISPKAFKRETQILLRCRLLNGNVTILDQCKNIEIKEDNPVAVDFEGSEQITDIVLTIWKREKGQAHWDIWYEDSSKLMPSFSLSLGMVGAKGTLDSKRLKDIAKTNNKLLDRITEVRKVKQVSYQDINIGDYTYDPWIPSIRTTENLANQLFPEPSKGRFFRQGWYSEGGLSFIEWFQGLGKADKAANKVFVLDPYFDVGGVEMIARLESTKVEYIVLTNTQAVEEPEQRERKIIAACEALEILLSSLNFSLLDLQKKGKAGQVFHDRYILLFDQNDQIQEGYNLSNSIQLATKNYPLLVTPIPTDLFNDIQKYIYDLLKKDEKSWDIVTLFSSQAPKKEIPKKQFLERVPNPGHFFSVLLQRNELNSMSIEELRNVLVEENILTGNQYDVTIPKSVTFHLKAVIDRLKEAAPKDFAKLWIVLCEWFAHSGNMGHELDILLNNTDERLAINVCTFLSNVDKEDPPLGILGVKVHKEGTGILYLLNKNDFTKILRDARYYYNYPLRPRYGLWSVLYGLRFLTIVAPEILIELLSEKSKYFRSGSYKYDLSPETQALGVFFEYAISEIVEELHPEEEKKLLKALLSSDVPLLRAIGVQRLLFIPLDNAPWTFEEVLTWLRDLDMRDRIHALAEWGFELRVKAKQNVFKETEEVKRLRLAVFEEMKAIWQKQISKEELREIVSRLSGPIEGAWALSTTNELLLPLMNSGKMEFRQIQELWFLIFYDHLEKEFRIHSDASLTETCGLILANLSDTERISYLKQITNIIKKNQQVYEKPFSQSVDYSAWSNSSKVLLWIQTLLKLSKLYMILDKKALEIEKQKDIEDNVGFIEQILSPYKSQMMLQQELQDFALEVEKRLKEEMEKDT